MKLFKAANEWKVSQSFASPAVWDRLSRRAEQTGERILTLRKVFSCGAPVPAKVIRRTLAMVAPDAEMHTPYGATESLPVATIEAQAILSETAAKTDEGAGVCVGKRFDNVEWRIIKITDDPIATIDETEELPQGEIGELIVRAPQVSREYLADNDEARMTNDEPASASSSFDIRASSFHNKVSKIVDSDTIWHRIGDVGYFDEQQRFWYCGRKSQRVVTSEGTLFTIPLESQMNTHPYVAQSALIGYGERGEQIAAIAYDPNIEEYLRQHDGVLNIDQLSEIVEAFATDTFAPQQLTGAWMYSPLPTDIRHNSKINREKLAEEMAALFLESKAMAENNAGR